MARKPVLSYDVILETIAQYKAAGIIWNQERESLKYEMNRSFAADTAVIHYDNDEFMELVRAEPRDPFLHELYYAHVSEARLAASAIKKIKAAQKKFNAADNAWGNRAIAIMEPWVALFAEFDSLKSMVKKGRQPNPDRVTPLRTLDNTGTCPICEKNVKLDGGRLVHHGYQVQWHQFVGGCFGVGHEPIEVSNQALIDYIAFLTAHGEMAQTNLNSHKASVLDGTIRLGMWETKAKKHNALHKMFTRAEMEALEPGHFAVVSREIVRDLEFQIKQVAYTKGIIQRKLDTWAPRPLPDAK